MPIRPLPKELQQKAAEEINEAADRIPEDLKHIREWLDKQPHLNCRNDDQWLLSFLRGCKFSLERTKEKLDFYYTMRTLTPEIFTNRDPLLPEIQELLKQGIILPLPKTDKEGPLIFLFREKAENANFITRQKLFFMVIDILLNENDNFVIAGMELLVDYKEYALSNLVQLTPASCKKCMMSIQDAYPLRIKGVHCINTLSFFDKLLNLFRPFVSEKIKNRIHIYGNNFSGLYNDIPLRLLPKEYGGEGSCVDELTADWKKKVESYRQWFLDDARYCSDEKKRLGKPKTSASVFGIEGSFRKLTVD